MTGNQLCAGFNFLKSFLPLLLLLLVGCGTAIPPEEYEKYAFVISGVPDGSYPCKQGSMVSCEVIRSIDGVVLFPASTRIVLQPGIHQLVAGAYLYKFNAEGGYRYVLKPNSIAVSLRRDETQQQIDELMSLNGVFLSASIVQKHNVEKENTRAIEEAKRVARELPQIRKIGAEVCQFVSGRVKNHGYVEAISDSKVKINVDFGVYGGVMRWDTPENWQLCSAN